MTDKIATALPASLPNRYSPLSFQRSAAGRRIAPARCGLLVCALALATLGTIPRAAAQSMRVAIENSAEPLSFEKPGGQLAGFSVDLIHAISREMGFAVEPVVGPWEEVFGKFKAGEADAVASVAYTRERDKYIDYAVTHLTMHGAIFMRRDGPVLRAPADLAKVRVALQRDSFSHEYLRARGWDRHPYYVDNAQEAMRALEEGRCDAVTPVELVGHHLVKQLGLKNVVSSGLRLADFTFTLHMGVRAGDADRLATLNEGLARVRANGAYDAIHERWIGPLERRSLRLSDWMPFLLPLAAIALVVTAALIWQRRLLRMNAEQARQLAASEERLRHVLDGSQDGFWDSDVASGRIERSERWASMLGYSRAEIEPTLEAGRALIHPDDLPAFLVSQARLRDGADDRYAIEYRMRAKSGEWRWILDRGKVIARSTDGHPLRVCGTHTDVTDRKRTEAALMQSQALLKRSAQLLEQSQAAARVGGWETDLRTGCVYWTRETYRIHETTPEQFYPTRDAVYAFYTPESQRKLRAAAAKAISDGTPYALDLELVTAKNRLIHVQTSGVAEFENGRVIKIYGSFRDITAEKNAEAERQNLQVKMLEAQKLESLGVLAGGIAHDFNNLLTGILANASMLQAVDIPHDSRLAHIESAARRAADLCRQMLAYAGKSNVMIEPVDLGGLVQETAHLIHASVSKKARLELSLESSLPPVEADSSQLRQVVMNLVINASEALGDAPGSIRLATRLARPESAPADVRHSFELPAGDCVCLEVSDTGSGMAAATLARIFDPFFTTKFTGRGLGLAAVLGIVRAHHGALTVESKPGQGSTFRLFLPASLRPRAVAAKPASIASATAPVLAGAVLIADDELLMRETVATLLQHAGYKTEIAVDGADALDRFRADPPRFSAVLLDLTMPGIDGAEVARTIRSASPDVAIVIMSGFSEQEVFAQLSGVSEILVLRKPFTHQQLLAALHHVTAAAAAGKGT